jgi:nucleotide-binding universal stress UspA family protein
MPIPAEVTRISLKNVLLPTDFSESSRTAVPFARAIAQVYGASILLAYAIPPEPHQSVVFDRVPPYDDVVWLDARQKLTNFGETEPFAGLHCKFLLGQGALSDVIPEMIRDNQVDLVILGTHGRKGLGRLALGSGAEQIYRASPCPVLTVGPKVHPPAEWKLRSVLCAVDLSENPEPALRYALSLAEENQANIIILGTISPVPFQYRASEEERARRAVETLIPPHAADWCKPEIVFRSDYPAAAILQLAHEEAANLIVMSVHTARAAALSSHLPWPTASEVLSRAECPVLTVRIT